MKVGAFSAPPLKAVAPPPPQQAEDKPAEPKEEKDSFQLSETLSRIGGNVLHGLAKIPTAYRYVPGLLRFAVVDGLVTTLQVTAGLTGLAGMAGLSVAGFVDVYNGIKKKDPVQALGGAGEIARGLFVGGLAASKAFDLGAHTALVGTGAQAFGWASGVLSLGSGVCKLHRGIKNGDRKEKLVGMLECGMAAASFCLLGGMAFTPVLIAQGAMAAAKTIYTNWDTIVSVGGAIKRKAGQLWNKFVDIFREPPKAGEATSEPPEKAPSQTSPGKSVDPSRPIEPKRFPAYWI
ncbi:MAG: hypothetical protein AB7S38_19570 [Vulcanimicrobiota bacterium]